MSVKYEAACAAIVDFVEEVGGPPVDIRRNMLRRMRVPVARTP
jgi:hypothetical protein